MADIEDFLASGQQPHLCAGGANPTGATATATGATDFTHIPAPSAASQLPSPFQRAAAEATNVHGLEVPVAMMSWESDDTSSDQDIAAIVKTASTGIRKVAAAVHPTDSLSTRLPPDMGSSTFQRVKDANQVAVPVSAAPKLERAEATAEVGGAANTTAPAKASHRRASTLPLGTRSDSSRAGLGLPPLGGGSLGASLARLKGRAPKAGSGISVITSDDINRQTEAARRASEAKAALGAAEASPLKQSMLLRGSADAVTVAFGGVTTGASSQTHAGFDLAGPQYNPGFCTSGDQLSPRGSTVTTSLPFAPGFGGAAAGHSRGAHGVKGDPDYTPPSNARPTTRAASRRRGRSAAPLQRLPTIDADLPTDEDEDALFDDPGSLRRGRKKVGRPITFKGDINNPNLTHEERRRIKRRVANRESAQRVRHKRQVQLEELQAKVTALSAQNVELRGALAEADAARTLLAAQVEGLRARWSGNTQRAALLQARAAAITAAQQYHHQQQQQQMALPKVVLSTAPMVPEPSTEPMAVAGYPPASASAAVPVCNLPPVPDLDMLLPPAASPAPKVLPAPQPAILHLAIDSRAQTAAATAAAPADATGPAAMDAQPTQPGGGLCMQPSSFSDTLPFAEELAAVAAQLSAPLPQMGADRGSSPLLAAATSLDLPPCSHAILGGGEGSAFHAVGPAQPVNNAVMSRNLSWSLDAADALAPAASPGAGDAAARVSPQSWGLYRQLTVADAC